MRLLAFAALLMFSGAVRAQVPPATPPPRPHATPASTPTTVRAPSSSPNIRRFGSAFPLNPVSESDRLANRIVSLQRVVAPIYRKPSGRELEAVAVEPELISRYREFLRLPETGIVKLVPDVGCAPNAKVINVRDDCLKYSMPGAGNSFSFRTGNYRIRHLADITYEDGYLRVTGLFMHGVMTSLGDVPIEGLNLSSPGMRFITDFKPSTSAAEVNQIDDSFRKGLDVYGYRYSMSVPVQAGATYLYRGVAYRGKVIRSADGIRYNELDFDKREDVIVTFRIVRVAEDDSITLLWRILAENDAPKIKMPSWDDVGEDRLSGGN